MSGTYNLIGEMSLKKKKQLYSTQVSVCDKCQSLMEKRIYYKYQSIKTSKPLVKIALLVQSIKPSLPFHKYAQ